MLTYEDIEGNGVFDSGHSVSDVQHVQKTTADRHSRHRLSTINNAARSWCFRCSSRVMPACQRMP